MDALLVFYKYVSVAMVHSCGREMLVIKPRLERATVVNGAKFNYPFPENLQQCDEYSHRQKFSLIDITGKVLQ